MVEYICKGKKGILPIKKERIKEKREMKVIYEMENGKKVKVKTYVDGSVYKHDENGNEI